MRPGRGPIDRKVTGEGKAECEKGNSPWFSRRKEAKGEETVSHGVSIGIDVSSWCLAISQMRHMTSKRIM